MIIARRTLTLRQQGQNHPVEVTLAAPRFETGCWLYCYEIHWPSGPRRFYGAGADSTQALVIAMQMVSAELYTSAPGKAGELFFETPGTGVGFPGPPCGIY
jgi:hypothetical protein